MANLLESKRIKWVLFRRTDDGEIKADVDWAVARYEKRHGNKPNSAYCHVPLEESLPGGKLALALAAKGLEVKPAKYCGNLFYYLGYVPEGVANVEN